MAFVPGEFTFPDLDTEDKMLFQVARSVLKDCFSRRMGYVWKYGPLPGRTFKTRLRHLWYVKKRRRQHGII